MSGPLYVPVLSARKFQRKAYADLRPNVQAVVAPLWNLPPCPGISAARLKRDWRPAFSSLCAGQAVSPGWFDALFADDAQAAAVWELLDECADLFCELRPVTGPDRSRRQQAAALDAARGNGHGIGVRVRVPGHWGEGATAGTIGDLDRLLALARPDVPVDLLLDMGAVLRDRPDASKEALRALDALFDMADWRTVAVIGAGYPPSTGNMAEGGMPHEEPRTDWVMWHEIRASSPRYLPRLTYGDYATLPAVALNWTDDRPAPWGVLRYTVDRYFVLCKVRTENPERTWDVRSAARRIRDLSDFRGARASKGEEWLDKCAKGSDSSGEGAGRLGDWQWAGNVQHMAYVVGCLRQT